MSDEHNDHDGCNCGRDHDKVLVEAMPEMMVLRAANDLAEEMDDPITDALGTVVASISGESMDRLMQFAILEGMDPREAVHNYGASMLARGIFMGAMMRNFYGDKFGTVEIPSDEEVAEAIERHKQHREEMAQQIRSLSADDLPAGLREQLEKAGLDLEKVGIMAMGFPRDSEGRFQKHESASEDETPPPGLYL